MKVGNKLAKQFVAMKAFIIDEEQDIIFFDV